MGKISKTVQQCMESFWLKQMKLEEWRQQGWGDDADYLRARDKNYVKDKLKVPAVVKLERMNCSHTCADNIRRSYGDC